MLPGRVRGAAARAEKMVADIKLKSRNYGGLYREDRARTDVCPKCGKLAKGIKISAPINLGLQATPSSQSAKYNPRAGFAIWA